MSLGKVTVNNLNQGQGDVAAIERHFLFVGLAGAEGEESQLFSVNAQTDLEDLLAASNLRTQLIAAQLNAGQNWTAAVYPLADDEDVFDAITAANEVQSFEAVVFCDASTAGANLSDKHDYLESLKASHGRFVFGIAATPGIAALQTWTQYETAAVAIQAGIAAHLIMAVPQLHGNNVGVLAGRLCNRSVSIADSPMRVATGAVLGLGAAPVDSAEKPLALATLNTLAEARLSVPQWYPDLEGIYWADGTTLDAAGGDYQYIEHLRPVHKASREVRILAIRRVADRQLNSTPTSIALNTAYFMKPLRAMSKASQIGNTLFPGDIQPPQDGDISIAWTTNKAVTIYMKVRPYNSPKEITVNLMLDLRSQ